MVVLRIEEVRGKIGDFEYCWNMKVTAMKLEPLIFQNTVFISQDVYLHPIGTSFKLTLTIRDESSIFDGVVIRHTKCLVNGVQTTGIGIDIISPEYQDFVRNKILIV